MHPSTIAAAYLALLPLLSAPAAPASTPARAVASRDSSEATRDWHCQLLGGVSRWHWKEQRPDGSRFLTEDGWIPTGRAAIAWPTANFRMDASLEGAFGPVDYDGGLQTRSEDTIIETPWKSNTHYAIVALEGQISTRRLFGAFPIQPGVRLGFESRVRTIGSRVYDQPGEHGYVETWTSTSVAPLLALVVEPHPDWALRLDCAMRFFLGNNERISDLPGYKINSRGDIVSTEITFDLRPRLDRSFDIRAQGRYRRLLFEARYLSELYDPSRTNGIYGARQPRSELDRVDLRAGWEF